jgi:hypothetical protein
VNPRRCLVTFGPRQAEGVSGVQGLAVVKRQVPVGQLNRRPGGHHRPRGLEGTQPGRDSLVWNVETPMGLRIRGVRWADREEGRSSQRDRMAKKRTPAGRKATENRDNRNAALSVAGLG